MTRTGCCRRLPIANHGSWKRERHTVAAGAASWHGDIDHSLPAALQAHDTKRTVAMVFGSFRMHLNTCPLRAQVKITEAGYVNSQTPSGSAHRKDSRMPPFEPSDEHTAASHTWSAVPRTGQKPERISLAESAGVTMTSARIERSLTSEVGHTARSNGSP